MRKNIIKKSLIFSIILLFFLVSFTQNIIAIRQKNNNIIDMNSDFKPTNTESSKIGFDLAIIDLVPYLEEKEGSLFGKLHITPEIKNVGNTFVGGVKYFGNATYYFLNTRYSSSWGAILLGGLDPGETWIPKGGAGCIFLNFLPGIFTIEYEVYPLDSNPDNNYIRQVYIARGGGIVPFWKHLSILE
jgi:hypothetical protein